MELARKIFNDKRVLIMGLGTKGGGVESALFAHKHGANITITDLNDSKYLEDSLKLLVSIPKKLVLNQHCYEDFENHDIIIRNEGIKLKNPFIQHALKLGKQIETPISLFLKLYQKPFIGITGTKGKSFTTALVTHLLSVLNNKVVAAGNNCVSPLKDIEEDALFVLELSSWQLHEMGALNKSPKIACWLNFFPDHMNYYTSVDDYFRDKKNIIDYQQEADYFILPFGYTNLQNLPTKSSKIFFSTEDCSNYKLKRRESICYLKDRFIQLKTENEILNLFSLDKIGYSYALHQLELILASISITISYIISTNLSINIGITQIQQQLNTFKGLEHRFESIYKTEKFEIINDSAASTPESAVLALKAVRLRPMVLIAGGGGDKNLNYKNLAKEIVHNKIFVVLFEKDKTSEIILDELTILKYFQYQLVDGVKSAVDAAFKKLNKKGTVILSPACSGYPMFKDMFERGLEFKKIIKEKNNEII